MTGRKQRGDKSKAKGSEGSDSPRDPEQSQAPAPPPADSKEPEPPAPAEHEAARSKGSSSPRSSADSPNPSRSDWVTVKSPRELAADADQTSDSDGDSLPRPSSADPAEPARRLFSPPAPSASASSVPASRPSASPSTPGSRGLRPSDLFFTPGPSAANVHNQAHKRVIEEVRQVYADRDNGLSEMIRELKLPLLPPRERVSVLIIGNHSAGKSSFINWYIDELVQKESVAMETTGFVFVSHGPARATLKGRATQKQVEYLEGIEKFDNALNNLSTEVCASRARRFPMVDFIDTPGLTDGYLRYAFDINEIIVWMAPRVDLIFVFFDPHGQAMCARTMAVVDRLSKMTECKNKLHFFLTRADEIKTEAERSKVMAQVSQTLGRLANADASESPRSMEYKGEHALKVRVIYRPNAPGDMRQHEARREREGHAVDSFNQIYEAVDLIEQAIQGNVAVHCDKLEKQSNDILAEIDRTLEVEAAAVRTNKRVSFFGSVVHSIAAVIPLVFSVYLLHFAFASTALRDLRGSPAGAAVFRSVQRVSLLLAPIAQGPHRYEAVGIALGVFALLMVLSHLLSRCRRPQKPAAHLAKLRGWREFLVKALDDRNGGLVHRIFETYSTFKNN